MSISHEPIIITLKSQAYYIFYNSQYITYISNCIKLSAQTLSILNHQQIHTQIENYFNLMPTNLLNNFIERIKKKKKRENLYIGRLMSTACHWPNSFFSAITFKINLSFCRFIGLIAALDQQQPA